MQIMAQNVVEPRVRYVVEHDQQIGYGQPGENGICWRTHFTACQHDDVEYVGHAAKYAHEQAEVSVDWHVPGIRGGERERKTGT